MNSDELKLIANRIEDLRRTITDIKKHPPSVSEENFSKLEAFCRSELLDVRSKLFGCEQRIDRLKVIVFILVGWNIYTFFK